MWMKVSCVLLGLLFLATTPTFGQNGAYSDWYEDQYGYFDFTEDFVIICGDSQEGFDFLYQRLGYQYAYNSCGFEEPDFSYVPATDVHVLSSPAPGPFGTTTLTSFGDHYCAVWKQTELDDEFCNDVRAAEGWVRNHRIFQETPEVGCSEKGTIAGSLVNLGMPGCDGASVGMRFKWVEEAPWDDDWYYCGEWEQKVDKSPKFTCGK